MIEIFFEWSQMDSDGPFTLRKVGAGLYGVLKSEFQTHEVGIVPNLGLFRPSEI